VIEKAIQECIAQGITGKDITPFLLGRTMQFTKGRTLEANIALVRNNAAVGAEIAVKLALLQNSGFQPTPATKGNVEPPIETQPTLEPPAATQDEGPVDIMVIGSMAMDLTCTLSSASFQLRTSFPAKIHRSAGGVGHNVALAATYASLSRVRLVTAVNTDPVGNWLREHVKKVGLDVRYLSGEKGTAEYVAIHDSGGELVTAAADMRIIEELFREEVREAISEGSPKLLAFDGNLSPEAIQTILQTKSAEMRGTNVCVQLISPI
jgi:pseudouridylate synthase / pseudouridine kinase